MILFICDQEYDYDYLIFLQMDWVDVVTQGVYTMLFTSMACLTLTLLVFSLAFFLLRVLAGRVKAVQDESGVSVGFFHPYCNAGGGGERVLWCAVRAVQVIL